MNSHPVLDVLANRGVRLGLERVRALLTALGEPHRACPVVHVAGTNGKGSTCMFVTNALVKAGYRVGTTLSPHIEDFNERIRFDGVPVDDPTLIDGIEGLDREIEEWSHTIGLRETALTYFEFATVLAFRMFAAAPVDVMVVEVGMGGALDATNVVLPQVCAITSIGLDHVEHLGGTLAAIAGEKAGILKRGVPVVIGVLPQEARDVIEARAKGLGAPLWRPGADLVRELRKELWNLRTPGGSLQNVKLGLEGVHQGGNALVALGVLHRLRQQGFHVPDAAIAEGFATTTLSGRIDTILPGLIVDGAHNEDGAKALAAWLQTRPRPKSRILVFGQGFERDPGPIVAPLLPFVDEVVTASCRHPKARDAAALAALLDGRVPNLSEGGPIEDVLPEIYREADETIVTGSLFLAGAARSIVRSGAMDGITPGHGPAEEA